MAISMEYLREYGDRMPGGFFVYHADEEEEIVYANDVMYGIFGCADKEEFTELTGNTFHGLVYPEDLDRVQNSIIEQVTSDTRNHLDYVEYRILRKDGVIRWVDDYGRLVDTEEHGKVYYVLIRDITEKHVADQERFRMELELACEKHVVETKNAFLFGISHDIRTPMNAITGFTELAYRNADDPAQVREYLEKIKESNSSMLAMIDDLLEMSRLDYGRIEPREEDCELGEVLQAVADMFEKQIRDNGLTIKTDFDKPPGPVHMDSVSLRRVLENILNNAVKFTPEGGHIQFTARQISASEDGYIRYEFKVADTGIGISPEFMDKMFDAFEQEESSTVSGYGGTGLGLTVAKRLLDLIGGTIHVASTKDMGTTVTIGLTMKLTGTYAAGTDDRMPEEDNSDRKRILVVEDIEINRMLIDRMLRGGGYLVECVKDGNEAVRIVRANPEYFFDLILMDIRMPIMNGYEATRLIRGLHRRDTNVMPIIAVSSSATEEDLRMCRRVGMVGHVAKPFDVTELLAEIEKQLN